MKSPEDDGLYQEIEAQIVYVLYKKQRYTFWKNTTRVLLLVLSAIITLVSGWDATQTDRVSTHIASFEFSQDHVVLLLSTLVTLITALEAFFKYTDKSSTYSLMHFEFKTLLRRMSYDYEKDVELYTNTKDEYFKQYQDILSSQKDLIDDSNNS